MPDRRKAKMPDHLVFGSFRRARARANEVKCIGEIPAPIKRIAKDFTSVGDVRVEKEFDTDGTYTVHISPRPVLIDIDLLHIAMKKNSIKGFHVDGNPVKSFFFSINA